MNPYEILGVSAEASNAEVEKAFREKAKKYHPDHGGDSWALRIVEEAYQQIRNTKFEISKDQSEAAPVGTHDDTASHKSVWRRWQDRARGRGGSEKMIAYGRSVLRSVFRVHRILHPTDFSPGSEFAFAHALRLALDVGASLKILHVDRHPEQLQWKDYPKVRDTLHRWGALPHGASKADLAKLDVGVEKVKAYGTDPIASVLEALNRKPVDLIVLATHQRKGLDRWLHKEVAAKIARLSTVKTLFVPHDVDGFVRLHDGKVNLQRVLIPVSDVPCPEPAIRCAAAITLALDQAATNFNVFHVGNAVRFVSSLSLPHDEYWSWETSFSNGDIVEEIVNSAQRNQCGLITLTTQGHHGFLDALRGSTTDQILHHANCPVLAVPVE